MLASTAALGGAGVRIRLRACPEPAADGRRGFVGFLVAGWWGGVLATVAVFAPQRGHDLWSPPKSIPHLSGRAAPGAIHLSSAAESPGWCGVAGLPWPSRFKGPGFPVLADHRPGCGYAVVRTASRQQPDTVQKTWSAELQRPVTAQATNRGENSPVPNWTARRSVLSAPPGERAGHCDGRCWAVTGSVFSGVG